MITILFKSVDFFFFFFSFAVFKQHEIAISANLGPKCYFPGAIMYVSDMSIVDISTLLRCILSSAFRI
jgi:hypothetical protein